MYPYNSILIMAVYILTLCIIIYIGYRNRWYELTHLNLFKQPLFRLSVFIPFGTFIYFGIWVWWGHSPEFSVSGYANFYDISKLPLLFLASSVPFAAIVSNIHRTIQTEAQISETHTKNKSDSYYSHLKMVTEFIEKNSGIDLQYGDEKKRMRVAHPHRLYHVIFENSNAQSGVNYSLNKSLIENTNFKWDKINSEIRAFIENFTKLLNINEPDYSSHSQEWQESLMLNIHNIDLHLIEIYELFYIKGYYFDKMAIFHGKSIGIQCTFRNHSDFLNKIEAAHSVCLSIYEIMNSSDESINEKLKSGFITSHVRNFLKFYNFDSQLKHMIDIPYKSPTSFKL